MNAGGGEPVVGYPNSGQSGNQVISQPSQMSQGQAMPGQGRVVQAGGLNGGQPMPTGQTQQAGNGGQFASGQPGPMNQSNRDNSGQSVLAQPAGQGGQSQDATQSALQMLASLGGQQGQEQSTPNTAGQPQSDSQADAGFELPQFTAAPASNQPAVGGAFTVSLPGDQTIQLVLNNDSTFVWTATKAGQSSSFQGRYILENGRLNLVRSNDLQQMTGTWTQTQQGASFKLDGTNASALEFNRIDS